MIGSTFLAYSAYGHVFLMDWTTKKGRIVGKWPIDEDEAFDRDSSEYVDPEITGAISKDGTLVVVTGPTDDDDNDDAPPRYNIMRFFNVNTRQCSVKKLTLDPALDSHIDIMEMSLNPYHNLLYLVCSYHSFDDSIEVPTDQDLVVYDFVEGKILRVAKGADVKMSPIIDSMIYDTIEGPVFVQHGHMIIVYHISSEVDMITGADYILLLDAFTLDTVASVKLSPPNCILNYHFIISTCQTQIAVFKKNVAQEVKVYKIPVVNISLMYQCKQAIIRCVGCLDKLKKLTVLPQALRDYLE